MDTLDNIIASSYNFGTEGGSTKTNVGYWIIFPILSVGEDTCVSVGEREIGTTAQRNTKPVHKHHTFAWWVVASFLDSRTLRLHSTLVFSFFCPTSV